MGTERIQSYWLQWDATPSAGTSHAQRAVSVAGSNETLSFAEMIMMPYLSPLSDAIAYECRFKAKCVRGLLLDRCRDQGYMVKELQGWENGACIDRRECLVKKQVPDRVLSEWSHIECDLLFVLDIVSSERQCSMIARSRLLNKSMLILPRWNIAVQTTQHLS